MPLLVDTHGRPHRTLRVSVTDRCQLRCRYCLPHGIKEILSHEEILRFEEIVRILDVAAGAGFERVRFTGGEPLLRKNLAHLVELTRDLGRFKTIAVTTNGLLLEEQIDGLVMAGLTNLTVSIDALDPEAYAAMRGVDALEKVLAGIRAARRHEGLQLELNAVAIKGRTEQEIPRLIAFARETGVTIRFIELMPFEDIEWSEELLLKGEEILEIIAAQLGDDAIRELGRARKAAPSRRFEVGGDAAAGGQAVPPAPGMALFGGATDAESDSTVSRAAAPPIARPVSPLRFGLIEPVSNPFCEDCDRLRIRSDGMLFNCLFGEKGYDLRAPVRAGDEIAIRSLLEQAVREKGKGGMLEFNEQVTKRKRIMASIGG
jgi:cyclic pyranopterin phosphate synthase